MILCNYCNSPAELVSGEVIYPYRYDLEDLYFWYCEPCNAYVGCHKGDPNYTPFGTLANADLRYWRKQAHAKFDSLWKSGNMKRGEAYKWLSIRMEIKSKDCHIGSFNIEQCHRVVQLVNDSMRD